MKKILSFLLLSILTIFFISNIINVDAVNTINYSANFSTGLPSDWKLYDKCAVNKTTSAKATNGVIITHAGTVQASSYHGALHQINPNNLNDIGDFTLEMKFKINSYEAEDRWFGVMYHTKIDSSNNLTGYMMNYRVNGKSAQSTITIGDSGATFSDHMIKEKAGNVLNDNATHTLKIICSGSKVSHYMDNSLIINYDYKYYSDGLSQLYHSNGGFALIVNRMSLTVSSLTVTGERSAAKEFDTFLNVSYNPEDDFTGEVAAVIDVNSKDELQSLIKQNGIKPTTAIITVDENMNACDENKTSLGVSLRDIYLGYLYQRIIPAVYIKSETIAEKFIEYYYKNLNILDMFVVSDNPKIVKMVRDELCYIRGIIDYSKKTISKDDWQDVVEESNVSMASVVILNPKDANYEAIRYIQARFKSVWINNKSMKKIDVTEQVTSGAYGIIYDDFEFVYSVLKSYKNNAKMMNRMPYNIAHRGLCLSIAENSLEGFIQSYNNGATHIEIDIRLTKDNQIVIMHDDSLNRTTNGEGLVNQLTLNQIKKYKIDSYYDKQLGAVAIPNSSDYKDIPSLDEVFKEFKDKDVVLVVEIKSYEEELVRQMKTLIEKYDMADNMVVITFSNDQLVNMKNILPNIPTATLNSGSVDNLDSILTTLAVKNCGYDGGNWMAINGHYDKLALRGYSSWCWTYQNESEIWNAINRGILGVTNNEANKIADYALRIKFEEDIIVYGNYSSEQATIVAYDQKYNKTATVTIADKVEYDGYAHVIYQYTHQNEFGSYVVYSDKMTVLTKTLSDEIKTLNEILEKDVKSLTSDEVIILKQYKDKADELEANNVKGIDSKAIEEKLESYELSIKEDSNQGSNDNNQNQENNENTNNPNSDKQPVNFGCGGSVISSLFGILTLFSSIVILKKKRNIL